MASVSCAGLWKVYGQLDRAGIVSLIRDSRSTSEAAERLRLARCVPAVCDVGFEVFQNEIFVIMGLSGSGKSTVIRCLSRLVEPTLGEVIIDGRNVVGMSDRELTELRRRKISMVFQNFGLLPHLNVLDNVAFPLRVQGQSLEERRRVAQEMVELVGLGGRERSFPRELSGGMQQRVGIARSLAVKPDIWLLDEPFSALDPLIRRQMQDEFLRLQATLKKTIVFITHDFTEALRVADRIAIMRDGRIVQTGAAADLVLNPADEYVAEFTRDVPREKILTVGAIVEPLDGNAGADEPVEAGMKLYEAIRRMAGRRQPFRVVDQAGDIVGQVTAHSILAAIAPQRAA